MILSFMTKWPKTKEPTYFPEKILTSLYDKVEILYDKGYVEDFEQKYKNHCLDQNKPFKGIAFQSNPKHHTIREDPNDRWKADRDIHFYTGRYTSGGRIKFAPVVKCVSVQKIEIKWNYENRGKTHVSVFVDGKDLTREDMVKLLQNDGFTSVKGFSDYFNKDFTGKIIHWTDLKY